MEWKIVVALALALLLFVWTVYRGMRGIRLDEHPRH